MRLHLFYSIIFTAAIWGLSNAQDDSAVAYVDPAFPAQVKAADSPDTSIPFWRWGSLIRKTEQLIQEVETALASLPPSEPNRQIKAFGYHSDHLPIMNDLPDEPRWRVGLERGYLHREVSIALVPSVDHRTGGKQEGYGFPRRFTIEAVEEDGTANIVVDWRTQDFPDPGRLPVIFKLPETLAPIFRLNVYRGSEDQGLEYFALSELVMIIDNDLGSTEAVNASSSYASPPYWDVSYLNDWRLGLGLPVFESTPKDSDLVIQSDQLKDAKVRIRIDLGSKLHIPWTSLFPARSPGDISVPGYGFPRTVKIAVSSALRGGNLLNPQTYYQSTSPKDPGNDWVRIRGTRHKRIHNARWVEFTFSDFPTYNGVPTFALGEISIDHQDVNHALGRPIELIEGPEECAEQLGLLVDNLVSGRKISDRVVWLQGLAARKPLESELVMLQDSLDDQQKRYDRLVPTLLVVLVIILLVAAISTVVVVIRGRNKESQQLRKQITRDLHDDLGSKMATIALTSEFISSQTTNPDILEGSESILSTAGEMTTSLRDVLWFTDTDSDQVAQLIRRLAQIAQQMVDADRLSLTMPAIQSLPRKIIDLGKKREIIYFLREALNNAVKYSEAKKICIVVSWAGKRLGLIIEDNGKGFIISNQAENDQQSQRHYGLKAMEQRAKTLGAIYQLDSEPGKGTRVELDVPL